MGAGGLLQTCAAELFITLALTNRHRANLYFCAHWDAAGTRKERKFGKSCKGFESC